MKIHPSIAFPRQISPAPLTSLLACTARCFTRATRLRALAAALPLLASHAHAQAVWNPIDDRNYYEGDRNNYAPFWSYGKVVDDKGNVIHAGNWSGSGVPGLGGSPDVYIGAPGGVLCDVTVTLNSLTIQPGGTLFFFKAQALTVANTNFATDGTMGACTYTNTGTLLKSAGTGTFALDKDTAFVSTPGTTVAVDSGTLQLSGNRGLVDTVTFDPAAGTLIDLVAANGGNIFQGTLTNGTRGGTVQLSQGAMGGTQRYLDDPQPCTLAFTGNTFQWTGGSIGYYQQAAIFTNTGVVNIVGDAAKETDAAFTNQGLVIQTGTGAFNVGDYNSGGSFTNTAGATYDLQSDAPIGQSSYLFNNAGLFKKSGGTGTSTMTVSFQNQSGTVEVDSGTLQLPVDNNHGTSTGGVFDVAAGALLDLGGNGFFTGTYTGTGAGTVRLSAGALYPAAPGVTFNLPGALFQWTGGYVNGGSDAPFVNAGAMTLSGDAEKDSYSIFTNTGTMIQTGAGNFNVGTYHNYGLFTNAAGATYDLRSDAALTTDYYNEFHNAGLFKKSGGTGTSTMSALTTNTGTISVYTGTLLFAAPNNHEVVNVVGTTLTGGTWNVFDGATLNFDQLPALTVNQANVTLSGPTANFTNFSGLADNQGSFALLAGRQFVTVGDLSNEGTLLLDAGSTLHVAGNLTDSDAATLAITIGGTATQGSGSPGVLQANGAATLAGDLSLTFAANAVLPGGGDTLTILSAGSPVSGSFANVASGSRLATTDGKGSFRVTYGAGTNAVVLSDFLRPGQIDVPTATLAALVPSVTTNNRQIGEFLLTLSSAPSSDVVVNFTIKGTAVNGTDYVLLKATKKIKAGKTSKPIKVTPLGTGAGPGVKRTVVLTLQPGDGYTVATTGKVKVKIIGQ